MTVPIATIIEVVAARADYPVAELTAREANGKPPPRLVHLARKRAWWACRRLRPDFSTPKIGARFGGRDHTTILHGVGSYEVQRARDPKERAVGDALLITLTEMHRDSLLTTSDQVLIVAAMSGADIQEAARWANLPVAQVSMRLAKLASRIEHMRLGGLDDRAA
jgi:hypothetical protein